ncbi:MAG: SAM-dependent methyltransferase [Thermodesulfovibrionales bacterium]
MFMEMALYSPVHGYYMTDAARIGRAGDFYTSPHLHEIFAAMLGRQMEEMWGLMGHPDVFQVVEMGAGAGHLAKDMLEYLKWAEGKTLGTDNKRDIFRRLVYTIVEPNPLRRADQQALLGDLCDAITWCPDINALKPFSGCFLSNELLDAFPVRRVEMDDELMEIYVSLDGNDLVEVKVPCGGEAFEYVKDFALVFPKGYRTEVNLRIRDWIGKVSDKLMDGFVLTVDYGYPAWDYYSNDRCRGTLLCYHQHQMNEEPFEHVGEQDITAHINFSSLRRWGEEVGLETIGFCSQGTYLVSLGLDEVITERYGSEPDPFDIAKIKGLILPQGMGESHKVMIQYKGKGEPELRGFDLRNQVEKL